MYVLEIGINDDEVLISRKLKNSFITPDLINSLDMAKSKVSQDDTPAKFKSEFDLFASKHKLSNYTIEQVQDLWLYDKLNEVNRKVINYNHAYILKPFNSDIYDTSVYLFLAGPKQSKSYINDNLYIKNNVLNIRKFIYMLISEIEIASSD